MASTMFAADGGAEVAAALSQLEKASDAPAGGLEPPDIAAGELQNWDDDTPADAAWSNNMPAGDANPAPAADQPAPVAARRAASMTGPPMSGPTFSPASVVKPRNKEPTPRPSDTPAAPSPSGGRALQVTSTPAPTGAPVSEATTTPRAEAGSLPTGGMAPSSLLLCTADLRDDYTVLDVVSARAEGASYRAAVEALKGELRRGCERLGGDAVIQLRLEREDAGRVVYGTGTVVRRG